MEQHPIPQQISSYQFRLVGDMTLKQFFQLAGGIAVGLIFYSTPLLPIIKLPLAFLSIILGIALAFLPFEERPLEKWIVAFFKAIYSPTVFVWKKGSGNKKYFQDEESPNLQNLENQEKNIEKTLSGVKTSLNPYQKLEEAEMGFLTNLTNLFSGIPGQITNSIKPNIQAGVPSPEPVELKPKVLEIPQTQSVSVAQNTPKLVVEEKNEKPNIQTARVAPVIMGDEFISTNQAKFSVDAAPPTPATAPNIVVGQVVDDFRRILDSAIIEIRDSAGHPVRALRSNKLGHFITVTPLENGKYEIITEKDGYQFSPISFEATGEIIPPILVQGKLIADPNIPITQIMPNKHGVIIN